MNATVAHDDVCGAQAGTQFRGHWKKAHPRCPASRVLAGGSAAAADEALHQAVELVQGVQRTHQLKTGKKICSSPRKNSKLTISIIRFCSFFLTLN